MRNPRAGTDHELEVHRTPDPRRPRHRCRGLHGLQAERGHPRAAADDSAGGIALRRPRQRIGAGGAVLRAHRTWCADQRAGGRGAGEGRRSREEGPAALHHRPSRAQRAARRRAGPRDDHRGAPGAGAQHAEARGACAGAGPRRPGPRRAGGCAGTPRPPARHRRGRRHEPQRAADPRVRRGQRQGEACRGGVEPGIRAQGHVSRGPARLRGGRLLGEGRDGHDPHRARPLHCACADRRERAAHRCTPRPVCGRGARRQDADDAR